jgi:hypothetical protein
MGNFCTGGQVLFLAVFVFSDFSVKHFYFVVMRVFIRNYLFLDNRRRARFRSAAAGV